jgi:octaprenyl-diphosphate synthase
MTASTAMTLSAYNSDSEQRTKASLARLQQLVADDLKRVDALILEKVKNGIPLIHDLTRHIIASGGKRLRPSLTLIAAQLCGYTGSRHIPLAACVEFIHTATLLHDDVVDNSSLRRGEPTANVVWSNKASVLVGDFLFSRSFQLMVEDGSLKVLKLLSDASATIAQGEVMQLSTANNVATNLEEYLAVIDAKTATLFAAACAIGAVVSEQGEKAEENLYHFGRDFGIAFQLVDDVLDYSASEASLGKTVGDDFRDGKVTLPIILAMEKASESERQFWKRTLEDQEQQEGDFEKALELMQRYGTLKASVEQAVAYGESAKNRLKDFPASAAKEALIDAVDFCIMRAF